LEDERPSPACAPPAVAMKLQEGPNLAGLELERKLLPLTSSDKHPSGGVRHWQKGHIAFNKQNQLVTLENKRGKILRDFEESFPTIRHSRIACS